MTTATQEKSEAIRRRMSEIRSELPCDVDDARQRVRQLSDWKYHVAKRPLPVLAIAAVAGYLLMPAKRPVDRVVIRREGDAEVAATPAKRSVVGGIVGALGTIAARQATAYATARISQMLQPERPS
ncbi:hypothetical protein K227x_02060 [Rubripirellula lacrimiformis]|uniref:DUF3618 domain-containing protein n=1 Tax=Rubripirellula lacrimiformis TaxID=1930273 RepID=A0A517N3W9_9BACT|nr:hypothetical protein [Rubripirellula lacrimiformis]QDT01837.1 hypothetical protein K227x_02060 [Rubripirellula lacrimiformis]